MVGYHVSSMEPLVDLPGNGRFEGEEVASLVESVVRMADTSLLEMSNSRMQTSESRDQIENIKRMLVSMVDDARVAVLKLAERVVALRAAKMSSVERQQRIAQRRRR